MKSSPVLTSNLRYIALYIYNEEAELQLNRLMIIHQLQKLNPLILLTHLIFVLWTLCCQFLWIVHFWLLLSFRVSLLFICPVACVPDVASVSRLSILNAPFGFLYCLFVMCHACPFVSVYRLSILIAPSVFSNVYLQVYWWCSFD